MGIVFDTAAWGAGGLLELIELKLGFTIVVLRGVICSEVHENGKRFNLVWFDSVRQASFCRGCSLV